MQRHANDFKFFSHRKICCVDFSYSWHHSLSLCGDDGVLWILLWTTSYGCLCPKSSQQIFHIVGTTLFCCAVMVECFGFCYEQQVMDAYVNPLFERRRRGVWDFPMKFFICTWAYMQSRVFFWHTIIKESVVIIIWALSESILWCPLSVCPSVHPSVRPSVCPPDHPSVFSSVCLPNPLFMSTDMPIVIKFTTNNSLALNQAITGDKSEKGRRDSTSG